MAENSAPPSPPPPGRRFRKPKKIFIFLAILLAAWGWYRGTLHWRATSERDRLQALGQPVTPHDWHQWAQPNPYNPWLTPWYFLVGQSDIQRLKVLNQQLEAAETNPQPAK